MTPHLDVHDLLDLSFGTAASPHLATCARCQADAAATEEAFHLIALGLAPIAPPSELRVRVLAAVAGPITGHAGPLARMFDRPESELSALLAQVQAGTAAWSRLSPSIEHHPLALGPGREGGLFRIAPGKRFPYHRHLGDERLRVLQGSCSDSGGAALGPGDELLHPAGSAHGLIAHPGPPLVLAYIGAGVELMRPPA